MQVEITDAGPVVPADEVAPLLGLEPADLPRLMREGIVTGRHEVGQDEDAGRFRLTLRYGTRSVRLTCTDDGNVLSRVRISVPDPAG